MAPVFAAGDVPVSRRSSRLPLCRTWHRSLLPTIGFRTGRPPPRYTGVLRRIASHSPAPCHCSTRPSPWRGRLGGAPRHGATVGGSVRRRGGGPVRPWARRGHRATRKLAATVGNWLRPSETGCDAETGCDTVMPPTGHPSPLAQPCKIRARPQGILQGAGLHRRLSPLRRPRVKSVPSLEVAGRANGGGAGNGAGIQPVDVVHRA